MHILIIEDGSEYMDAFSQIMPDLVYHSARSGNEALNILEQEVIDVVFLDMRFDRSSREDLLGDHAAAMNLCNGDPERAWNYIADNQGLFILDALGRKGFGKKRIILAYDFSREPSRFKKLKSIYPRLKYLEDDPGNEDIQTLFSMDS